MPVNAPQAADSLLCQIETAHNGTRLRRPGFLYFAVRLAHIFRSGGVAQAAKTSLQPRLAALWNRITAAGGETESPRRARQADETLHLLPGEMVEVKSLAEIQVTLDEMSRFRGLTFTPEMRQHCGRRFRVYKRLELTFDEHHKSQRRVKNTVLLEGVVCTGAGLGCDRSCFLYWREAWLRRVPVGGVSSCTADSD